MVAPLAVLGGLSFASDVLGGISARRGASRRERYGRRLLRRRQRSPEAMSLREALGSIDEQIEGIPRLQRGIEARAVGQKQMELRNLNEILGASGISQASELGMRRRRGALERIDMNKLRSILGMEQLKSTLAGQKAGMAGRAMDLLYPTPGQAASVAQPQFYDDPTSLITNMLPLMLLGGQGGNRFDPASIAEPTPNIGGSYPGAYGRVI
jgi:hypothetical protein